MNARQMFAEPGSGAWLNVRVGKLTASRMADAMATLKNGKPGAARLDLLKELLAERLTGDAVPHAVTPAMRFGLESEPAGKAEFEEETGILLTPCGFIEHPKIANFGCTADSLIGADTVFEMKTPNSKTHAGWMMDGEVPEQHRPQILAQLACTGRNKAVFMSYDPRIPNSRRLFIKHWEPAAEEIAAVELAAKAFLADLEAAWEQLKVTE